MFESLKRKSKTEICLYCFVSILFLAVALSYLYILFWAFMSGSKTHNEIVMNPLALPETWHLEHYIDVFKLLEVNGHGFGEMLFNSCWFSVVGSLLQQFVTITFAYCCTKYKFPGSDIPYTLILIMMTLPIYGAGGATYKLYRKLGLIDTYAHVLCAAGGMSAQFLYYRAFFQNLSWTYAEAAMVDGAGPFVLYFRVMLPQAKPMFGALFLTTWLASWNSYESTLLYLPDVPTLPVGIFQFNAEMMYRARLDILFAACIIISIPAVVLFVAFNKMLTTSISVGGIKG